MTRKKSFNTVVLREATRDDTRALTRLAALDSTRALRGRVLLAEADGELVAALGTEDGRSVADPFTPSQSLVDLLRVHARAA